MRRLAAEGDHAAGAQHAQELGEGAVEVGQVVEDRVAEDDVERLVLEWQLARHARGAGFDTVKVRGEELAASLFGWANRSFEASARPEDVPDIWRKYAYHGYLALQKVDRAVLEPRLPPAVFYNLLVSAQKPLAG